MRPNHDWTKNDGVICLFIAGLVGRVACTRFEHLLTDADKWAAFRRDILWCAGSAALSVIFAMVTAEKKLAVYTLLLCLAMPVGILAAYVLGDAFIHWRFDMQLFSDAIWVVGVATMGMLPFAAFFTARI